MKIYNLGIIIYFPTPYFRFSLFVMSNIVSLSKLVGRSCIRFDVSNSN